MNGIVSRNLKAIQAFIGGLITVSALLLVISAHLPTPVAAVVGSIGVVLTTVQTWLSKNEPLIKQAETAIDELVSDVKSDPAEPVAPAVVETAPAPKRRTRAKAPAVDLA